MASNPQPGTWYLTNQFNFDLSKVYNRQRRGDLDGKPFNGHSGLKDVWQGDALLESGTFAVYYGTTPVQFYLAPPGSIIWCLRI